MFCPNCGKEYQENQNFCRFCGTKLNENTENVAEKNLENEKTVSEQPNVQETEIQPENTTVDLTIKNQTDENSDEQTENELSPENTSEIDKQEETTEQEEEEPETLKEEVNDFFTDLKNSLIIETPEGKKLTPSAITLLVVLFLFIVFMGNLLWSINDAIQINPSMTNENALMNIPNDNEDGAYTQTPEPTEEENTEEEQQEETQEEQTYSEQPQPVEEAPIVPIEEVRQREQQFPEPEIPAPQEFTDALEH